jgi:putative sterol carrier protein
VAVEFGTVGFYEAMADQLNSDPVWAEKGASLEYDLVFRYGAPLNRDFWMSLKGGKVLNVHQATPEEAETAPFVISAEPEVWRSIFAGEVNPTIAMARGKVKVQGSTSELMRNMAAFKHIIDTMAQIEFV